MARLLKNSNIVLVHGWGASTAKLEPLGKELKRLKWKVFIPSLPGFDLKPPEFAWEVGDYANYVLSSAKKHFKGKKFFIFGHSFGGRIVIKLVFNNPDKISGMVLCSASGLSRTYLLKRWFFAALAKFGKIFLINLSLASIWRKLLYKLAREHDYENTQGVMRDIFRKVIGEDLKEELSAITNPTLVFWGENDRMTPLKGARLIKKLLPGARLITYKNSGHDLPYDKTKELASEIERWSKSIKS